MEQRFHALAVIEHGAVDDAGRFVGKVLEVLVVRGDDAKHTFLVEFLKDSLCDGSANLRLGTAAKFVDEDERVAVAKGEKTLHVLQV